MVANAAVACLCFFVINLFDDFNLLFQMAPLQSASPINSSMVYLERKRELQTEAGARGFL